MRQAIESIQIMKSGDVATDECCGLCIVPTASGSRNDSINEVEEMIEEEMDHFNINRDFPKPLALSDDESDEIILNAAKLLRESVINEIKYPSASDSFDSEFQDFFEVLNEGN